MSDEACPYCGAEYDLDEFWRIRDEPAMFTITCDECGRTFAVMVEMRPEFRAVKWDEKLGEKS